MASSYLGPESPAPLAVISEGAQHLFRIHECPSWENFTFGEKYDETILQLIDKHLELDTTDRLCYIGDPKGCLAKSIANRFCLLKPVLSVARGHNSYLETCGEKVQPIRGASLGCEEFFRWQVHETHVCQRKFDKIILKDVIRCLQNPKEMYANVMECLSKSGKILIIHRPSSINTLPVFQYAIQRSQNNEVHYSDIIHDLKSCDFDVQWEIECVPVIVTKINWFSMLQAKYPPQMEVLSDDEVRSGIRELSDGIMRYEGEISEFTDRLIFIVVSNPAKKQKGCRGIVSRYHSNYLESFSNLKGFTYSLEMSEDLKKFISVKEKSKASKHKQR